MASPDWAPRVVKPSIAAPKAAEVTPPPIVVVKDEQPRPKRWRFTPLRDSENLIVEVLAEPEF